MRTFQVIVQQGQKRPIAYPAVVGEKALANMETLHARGLTVIAITSANDIEEQLSLDEMRDLYSDDEPQANTPAFCLAS